MSGVAAHGVFDPVAPARGNGRSSAIYSVMEECLRVQLRAQPRGAIARLFGRSPLHPDARSSYRGAADELRLAGVLSRLAPPFRVLTATSADPVTSADSSEADPPEADHLVIGPPGIYAVTEQNRERAAGPLAAPLTLLRERLPFLRKSTEDSRDSQQKADRASRQLGAIAGTLVEVTPLIVVADSAASPRARGVTVVDTAEVNGWFTRSPRVLSDDTIDYFAALAQHPGHWRLSESISDETRRHSQRFERLQLEVDAARNRARLWQISAAGSGIIVAGLVAAALWQFVPGIA